MSYWRESFKGNRMSPKWRATRWSLGGQLTGVWVQEVRDGKLYWKATSHGTESDYWGQWLSIPVNAVGDIIVEAQTRLKGPTAGGSPGLVSVGINHSVAASVIRYGAATVHATNNYFRGVIDYSNTPWPGLPSINQTRALGTDEITNIRIVRKNGYLHIYNKGIFMGSYAYATAISTVDLVFTIYGSGAPANLDKEMWVHQLSVSPREAVL